MSVISLREVTAATIRTICALEITEKQKRFVAPNALSIAQAHFEPQSSFRAVYGDEVPVGFVMWKPTDRTEVRLSLAIHDRPEVSRHGIRKEGDYTVDRSSPRCRVSTSADERRSGRWGTAWN